MPNRPAVPALPAVPAVAASAGNPRVGLAALDPALAARVLAQEHVIYPRALEWLASGRLSIADGRVRLTNAPPRDAALVSPA